MNRAYYSDSIPAFLCRSTDEILGHLTRSSEFSVLQSQQQAWNYQIKLLKSVLKAYDGKIYFEYSIPRMGRRIDVLLLLGPAIFVLEFKVGEKEFSVYGIDQVWDYALDLKNFHETTHEQFVVPVLIATDADNKIFAATLIPQHDRLFKPVMSNALQLQDVIKGALMLTDGTVINATKWENGRYCPTPTIIEAAMALYNDHSVADIKQCKSNSTSGNCIGAFLMSEEAHNEPVRSL